MRQKYYTLNLAENQLQYMPLLPKILVTSSKFTSWQAGGKVTLFGISIPKTCWDNPNPLSITLCVAAHFFEALKND